MYIYIYVLRVHDGPLLFKDHDVLACVNVHELSLKS